VTVKTDTWGPAGQFAATTIAGGTTSVITGGKFATGAQTAAFGYLFNACMSAQSCWQEAAEGFTKAWTYVGEKWIKASAIFFSVGAMAPAAPAEALTVGAIAKYTSNDVYHLVGRGGAEVEALIAKYGSQEAALAAIHQSAQQIATSAYQTGAWVTVKVGETAVAVKGRVMDGIFRLSSIAKEPFKK
jgi:hypothetical protein